MFVAEETVGSVTIKELTVRSNLSANTGSATLPSGEIFPVILDPLAEVSDFSVTENLIIIPDRTENWLRLYSRKDGSELYEY